MTRTREDNVVQTTSIWYDDFGLAPTHIALGGSNVPTLDTYTRYDAVTQAPLCVTDVDGTVHGKTYDDFGRPLLTTIRVPGGNVGALSVASYLGFAGGDSLGRRVTLKTFADPIAPGAATGAAGRVATTYFDEVGRSRMTQIALGADYGGETLVVDSRSYDLLGRVVFAADPFPLSQNPATAYGTTRYFSADRSLRLSVRGYGPQPFTATPNASAELFPTLYTHSFDSHQEQMSVQNAASLTSPSTENGVIRATVTTALGRLLFRSTWRAGTRLEHAAFGEDRFGRLTTMIRYAQSGQRRQSGAARLPLRLARPAHRGRRLAGHAADAHLRQLRRPRRDALHAAGARAGAHHLARLRRLRPRDAPRGAERRCHRRGDGQRLRL